MNEAEALVPFRKHVMPDLRRLIEQSADRVAREHEWLGDVAGYVEYHAYQRGASLLAPEAQTILQNWIVDYLYQKVKVATTRINQREDRLAEARAHIDGLDTGNAIVCAAAGWTNCGDEVIPGL